MNRGVKMDRFKNRFKIRFWDKELKKFYYPNEHYMYKLDDTSLANLSVMLATTALEKEQCAGLKDKNGKLCYDGDIVIYSGHEKFNYDFVDGIDVVRNGGLIRVTYFEVGEDRADYELANWYLEPLRYLEYDFEVIGNIHENPELYPYYCEID